MKKRDAIYMTIISILVVNILLVFAVNYDLNGDGNVTIYDLQNFASHYRGKTPYNSSYDFNSDSKIDLFDLVGLAKRVNLSIDENPPVGLLFSDGFESGDKSHEENGVYWTSSSANVQVTSNNSHTGTYSLVFTYKGKPSGSDSTAEQNFDLARNLTEIWMEWYIYYPDGTEGLGARYEHRLDVSSNNNKYLRLWGNYPGQISHQGYGNDNEVGASTWPIGDTKDSKLGFEYQKDQRAMGAWGSGSIEPFVDDSVRGTWIQFRFHARLGVNNDSFMEMWRNDIHMIAVDNKDGTNNLHIFDPDGNYWNYGYLLGWANSGFDSDTSIFIDDIKIYDSDPGW